MRLPSFAGTARLLLLLVIPTSSIPGAAAAQELALSTRAPRFLYVSSPRATPVEVDVSRTTLLRRTVALDVERPTVGRLLAAIERQTGIRFGFSRDVVPVGRLVALRAETITVGAALLSILMDTGVDVLLSSNGKVALVKKGAEAAQGGTIVGRVTDQKSGEGLEEAVVRVEGTALTASSGADGLYRISNVPPGTYAVSVRRIAYVKQIQQVTVVADEEVTADFALEPAPTRLDELVTVTPGGMQTQVKALPTPVTVITGEEIALQRPRNIQELFRQVVPGAVSWDLAGRPETSPFSVRGASTLNPGGNQMKVFVDGIEVAYPNNTVVDPNSIARLEVTRGPQAAAVYGSDAIGGVVQISTKRGGTGQPLRLEAEASLGIIQTPYSTNSGTLRQEHAASVSGGTSDARYRLGAGYTRLGNWLPNGEQSEQSHPSVYAGLNFARGTVAMDLFGRYDVQNAPEVVSPELVQSGDFFSSKPFFTPIQYINQTLGARVSLAATGWWNHTVTLGIDRFSFDRVQSQARLLVPEDTLLILVSAAITKRSIGYNTTLVGELSPAVSASVTAGADHYHRPETTFSTFDALSTSGDILGTIGGYRVSTNNTGYFGQVQLGLRDALFLTGGLRAEQNTNFGDSLGTPVSPRVGLAYARTHGGTTIKVRGSWGRAIRAPDPGIKLSIGPGILPNPKLGPERSQGWDAGIDAVFGTLGSVSVTYYDQTAENLIQFTLVQVDPEPAQQFQNVGRVDNSGLEVETSIVLGSVRLRGTYGYARARVDALAPDYTGFLRVGDQVNATPKHTAGALLTATPRAGTTLSAGLGYVGSYDQLDILALSRCEAGTGACRPTLQDYISPFPSIVKLNATVWQQITRQVSGFLSFDNLTNNHSPESSNGLPVFGRISTAGVRVQF